MIIGEVVLFIKELVVFIRNGSTKVGRSNIYSCRRGSSNNRCSSWCYSTSSRKKVAIVVGVVVVVEVNIGVTAVGKTVIVVLRFYGSVNLRGMFEKNCLFCRFVALNPRGT